MPFRLSTFVLRSVTLMLLTSGIVLLGWLSYENHLLGNEVSQLEAELGRMPIKATDQCHIVAIETPDVPPEVSSRIERVWQFRVYLPPNYDFAQMGGSGRVAEKGVYFQGGFSGHWGSPRPEAIHDLLTISFTSVDERLMQFLSFQNSGGSLSFRWLTPDQVRSDQLVVQTLTDVESGPRSFDQETILPLLKIYDRRTAKVEQTNAGEEITTYAGGLIVLYPKSQEGRFEQLRQGIVSAETDENWVATGVEQ